MRLAYNSKAFWECTDAATRLKVVKGIPHFAYALEWSELSRKEKRAVNRALKEMQE